MTLPPLARYNTTHRAGDTEISPNLDTFIGCPRPFFVS